jgi:hypothetical protein
MTTRDEAKRTAMSYAWGREDESEESAALVRTKTAYRRDAGQIAGDWAFSEAYAQGHDDLNAGRRVDMLPVREAYRNWQASAGKSVFERGKLTLSDDQRAELRAAWPEQLALAGAYQAYYELETQFQDEAWAALG